jgi:hypothetical protein
MGAMTGGLLGAIGGGGWKFGKGAQKGIGAEEEDKIMGMSGKTFLSAFQMGAKMYPDILKSREDQIDKKAKRKVLNLQKRKLKGG